MIKLAKVITEGKSEMSCCYMAHTSPSPYFIYHQSLGEELRELSCGSSWKMMATEAAVWEEWLRGSSEQIIPLCLLLWAASEHSWCILWVFSRCAFTTLDVPYIRRAQSTAPLKTEMTQLRLNAQSLFPSA